MVFQILLYQFRVDQLKMRGFGFPGRSSNQSTYKADTSAKKVQLIDILKRSERLWNEDKFQQSLVQLRKAICILEFVISNETIETVKQTYSEKLKELKQRLKNRQDNKENEVQINGGGVYKKGNGAQNDSNALKAQIAQAIMTQKPNIKWDDVSGLVKAKESLKEAVVLPIKFPQIFTGSRKPWQGILLYGPPGTGKTFLAKACATEVQGTFFSVSSSDLLSKYVGEAQKTIKYLFAMAREKKPSIIFIDQIDSLCGSRSDGDNDATRRVKTEFLVQMQGVGHDQKGVLVLGATNLPWALDPAIRRRFDRRIYISLPEEEARLGMLKNGMKEDNHTLTEADFKFFAQKTEMYSGSDISILVTDAVYEPVRRLQAATRFKEVNGKYVPCKEGEQGQPGNWMDFPKEKVDIDSVSREDFELAFKRVKPSVDQKQLKEYQQFTSTFGQEG